VSARDGPISLRSVSGAIREHTPSEAVTAAFQNRFRYWDLKERCVVLHPMGFQSLRVPFKRFGIAVDRVIARRFHSGSNYHTRSVCGAKPKASTTSFKSAFRLRLDSAHCSTLPDYTRFISARRSLFQFSITRFHSPELRNALICVPTDRSQVAKWLSHDFSVD
jgi:hypothetical protein